MTTQVRRGVADNFNSEFGGCNDGQHVTITRGSLLRRRKGQAVKNTIFRQRRTNA